MIWVGPTIPPDRFDFPQVNEYLDATVIPVLRTAFEIYKRDDLLSDLIGHYRRQTEAAPTATDAIYPRLALSSFLWWNDDKDEAIAELTKVVDASRAESDLRLDLAGLLEKQGAYTDALALVDARQPLDNFALRRREELALRVALVSGDVERARQAAERLFGLRLDTETQISLGRPDAAARPARAGRRGARPRSPSGRQQGDGPGWPDAAISATAKTRSRPSRSPCRFSARLPRRARAMPMSASAC